MSNIQAVNDKDKVLAKLDQYRTSLKMPTVNVPQEISDIINLTRQELNGKSKHDLGVDVVRLSQYALYLAIEINKLKAASNWCDANIHAIIGREIKNTNGYGYPEKSSHIKYHDAMAKELCKLKLSVDGKITSLENVDRKLEFMSNSIRNLTYTKDN